MKHSDYPSCVSVKFLASTLIAGLALSCTESGNADKTDGALGPAGSTSSTQTSTTSTPTTSQTSDSPIATTGGPTANPTPTVTNTAVNPTTTTPVPSDTGALDPGGDDMGAGGTGSDDSTTDEPSTEPDATDATDDDSTSDSTDSDSDSDLTDTTTDETDPDATDEITDETTDETDTTTPGVADAPQCDAVIKGELTDCADTSEADPNFSFFIASRVSMVALSDNPLGFGGNLGGLECADQICALIAECVAPGNAQTWHALLSTTEVDAKDRIGTGPWYDVIGTKIADDLSGLMGLERPTTADGVVHQNLPNEFGCGNLTPACDDVKEDNHHVMTGSTPEGVYNEGRTCDDWTSTDATPGTGPACGLSWERQLFSGGGGGGGGGFGGQNWLNFANESGCAPGGNLTNDPPMGSNDGTVGSGGGYGAIYCFAVVE